MLSRRHFVGRAGAAVAAALPASSLLAATGDEPEVSGDGLYTQPWFMETFLDLEEDLEEARAEGKRFAVLWEQKGCPYCKELHWVNFADPETLDYVRGGFGILQLNLWGAREVTDFDGEVLEERKLARKWRVNFTPTLQFFPDTINAVAGRPGMEAEVARMPGYFKLFHFRAMFEFVQDRAYETSDFQRYLRDRARG